MVLLKRHWAATMLALVYPLLAWADYETVAVPAGIDHQKFDTLLKKHVNRVGLVDYAAWKASEEDSAELNAYIADYAVITGNTATGEDAAASLINLYNAITIQWILQNYPVESILETDDPWKEQRHLVGGKLVSLDDIEHGTLRPMIGWKVHSAVVCAARSCPPLQMDAFLPGKLEEQIEGAYVAFFSRIDLNRFSPNDGVAEISKVLKWYREDFDEVGGLEPILARFAPERHRAFLNSGKVEITFQRYHWGLNDQSDLGKEYTNLFYQ